jgi:menaquinone-specific isochorismate synthase
MSGTAVEPGTIKPNARHLVATTIPLPDDADLDLLAIGGAPGAYLFHAPGMVAVAGRGVALRIDLPYGLIEPGTTERVATILGAIPTDDTVGGPGTGPLVIGALPFQTGAPASLVIPETVVGRAPDGRKWLTTVGPAGAARASYESVETLPTLAPPDRFSLVSARPHEEWAGTIGDAVTAIRAGRLAKVVLAREVLVEGNRDFLPADILRRLHALYPSCMIFAVDGFVGASPELLVSRRGRDVRSHPLAGTVQRSGNPEADDELTNAMLASAKQRQEHRLVVDEVVAALRPCCDELVVPDSPSIVALRNVSHLGTSLTGHLTDPPPTSLDLVVRLHPTPAVAGSPTAAAVDYLHRVEGFDRGRYAGPVGWMDARGDGEWAVGIRSAEIRASTARLFAGVGVVADSDPESELVETQLKLQALLAAVVRP